MNSPQGETFVTSCPGCGKRYRMDRYYIGRQIRCKTCQVIWRVDQPSPPAANGGSTGTSGLQNSDSIATASQLISTGPQNLNSSTVDVEPKDEQNWIGQRLGRFQIVDVLGKGAMGIVFRAHDPDLKRDAALKILTRQFVRDQKRTYRLEQFIREARSAARLSHPNSVTVYEIGQDKGWFFIAMELVEGGTLLDMVLRKKRRAPIEQVCELIAEAADALSAAHKLGIVHRDIKPSNLMLGRDGRMKVADFGLAQVATESAGEFELPTKAVGTPYWMSPEQWKGETAVPQSDIYSLGAVLYFALTAEVPYKGKSRREIREQHLNAPVGDPRNIRKDIPESLVRIIQRAMAKKPVQRYQDAGEMAITLRQVASRLIQAKMAERWWGRLATAGVSGTSLPTGRSRSWLQALIIVLLLAAIAGGVLYLWPLNPKSAEPRKNEPTPQKTEVAPPVKIYPKVPVYVIKGTQLYHASGCNKLKDEPQEGLVKFESEQAAKESSLMGCIFCQKRLHDQQDQASKGISETTDTPATQP